MAKRGFKEGFTLVELSLSLLFIGILSVTVVLLINNTVSAYQRGLTLSRVNSVGMELVDDMRATVQNSPAGSLTNTCVYASTRENCNSDGGYKYMYFKVYGNIRIGNSSEVQEVPLYGGFCTGLYSYVWVSGYYDANNVTGDLLNEERRPVLRVDDDNDKTTAPKNIANKFRLIKIEDRGRSICIRRRGNDDSYNNDDANDLNYELEISNYGNIEPVELLPADSSNNLVLYDLYVAKPAINENSGLFYSVSFILGTVNGGINIKAGGNYCVPPSDEEDRDSENFDYCAINKFNFAAQANGE